MKENFSIEQMVGIDDSSIDYVSLNVPVHREIVNPFLNLCRRAKTQGFDLAIASGYRNFERQLLIWNEKAEGKRPVLDSDEKSVDLSELNEWQRVQAILRWSALPGTSRHHWGTDIDVYDRSAVGADYRVQLTESEAAADGVFGPMHRWLDQVVANDTAEGFFRPYAVDTGGIAPERWHLSYLPLAGIFQKRLTPEVIKSLLADQPISLKSAILTHLDEIFERFITSSYPG